MIVKRSDFLVIGAGIIGLAVARALAESYPKKSIAILEKEPGIAMHASGRNSGVLHAGFYYTADSLKARFSRDGNTKLKQFCVDHKLRINGCGKIVVAKSESDLEPLFELAKRAEANGVDARLIDAREAEELEPNAKTFENALYSPTTATVDPKEVCEALKKDLDRRGVSFYFGEGYSKKLGENAIIGSKSNRYEAGTIINAAGLYADKIARDFGFAKGYTIIPFKGLYLKYKGDNQPVRMNLYPVPHLKNPFLGVHYTVTVDGTIKIGPTAIPCFWRENYSGLKNFSISEFLSVVLSESQLFIRNSFSFRDLALEEIKKYRRCKFVSMAAELVKSLDANGFTEWSTPGIRAQLLDLKTLELAQDFVVEGDSSSVHILNAVSPAFTCSFPFAEWVVGKYIEKSP